MHWANMYNIRAVLAHFDLKSFRNACECLNYKNPMSFFVIESLEELASVTRDSGIVAVFCSTWLTECKTSHSWPVEDSYRLHLRSALAWWPWMSDGSLRRTGQQPLGDSLKATEVQISPLNVG